MATSTDIPQNVIDGTYGALFIGLLCSAILFGVGSAQAVIYFHHWKKDRPLFKRVVTVLWMLNTIQILLIIYTLYNWLISNYGNFAAIGRPSPTLLGQEYITAMSDLLVRCFFARRVFILLEVRRSKRQVLAWCLSILIFIISLFGFSIGSAYSTVIFIIQQGPPEGFSRIGQVAWMQYTFNVASAVADIIIAISLSTILAKKRTGFARTDSIVIHLMTFSISSGLVTSIFALLAMIIYAALPTYLISLGLSWIICQLHFNSLLLSLNARAAFRERHDEPSTISGVFSGGGASFPGSSSTQYAIPLKEAHAQVTVSKEVTISS